MSKKWYRVQLHTTVYADGPKEAREAIADMRGELFDVDYIQETLLSQVLDFKLDEDESDLEEKFLPGELKTMFGEH